MAVAHKELQKMKFQCLLNPVFGFKMVGLNMGLFNNYIMHGYLEDLDMNEKLSVDKRGPSY